MSGTRLPQRCDSPSREEGCENKDCKRRQSPGSTMAASSAGKTRTLLSPEAFLQRVPRRGLAVLFLCRVLFLRVIFFQVAYPKPLQTGHAIISS